MTENENIWIPKQWETVYAWSDIDDYNSGKVPPKIVEFLCKDERGSGYWCVDMRNNSDVAFYYEKIAKKKKINNLVNKNL